jgi:hypothetical protein
MTKPVKCRNVGDHIYMRWVDLPPEGMWVVCLKAHPKACKFELVQTPDSQARQN